MSAIATLVIYLNATDAADPTTSVLVHSAQEILGIEAQVTLRTSTAELTDAALSSVEPEADAVANIVWLNHAHSRATVRCYVGALHHIVKREVAFEDDAEPRERERMLGFVVASMLPPDTEERVASLAQTVAPPAKTDSPAPSAPSAPGTPVAREHFRGMAEALGLGATGFGGTASGFGVALAGRWFFAPAWAVRVAGGLRRGDIPAASATSEVQFLGLGVACSTPVSAGSRFTLGGRFSTLVLRHEVAHLSSDDREPARLSRVLLGADTAFEAGWSFSSSAGVVLGLGAEFASGHTTVFVKGKQIDNIPALRGLAELGIQARF